MPSKEKLSAGLDALLAPTRRSYRSAVVAAREELRALAAASQSEGEAPVKDPFSKRYLDSMLFAKYTPHQEHPAADVVRLEAALGVLSELLARGEDLFRIEVPKGGDLYALVFGRLAEVGRAFAAARAASLAQAGMPGGENEEAALAAWPFARWSRAERGLAPSLTISVHGADLAADALAAFADGSLRLGFEVLGESSPAPLVGLVRPGTFVAQLDEIAPSLKLPTATPAFIALLPEATRTTASFLHEASAEGASGEAIFSRLEITRLPETSPTGDLGPKSARQQLEELRQLAALAIEPRSAAVTATGTPPDEATAAAAAAASGSADPIDRLAAWLLERRQE